MESISFDAACSAISRAKKITRRAGFEYLLNIDPPMGLRIDI
ncbi:MAG TPA: hypothetical protein VGS27_24390 [Candidatus Sulfotelmatobacter sp.]|nr:hypothetical protein [Candidatus Sulfotelmatobacter sp.]